MITEAVDCTIERRLLVNYRIKPEFVVPLLPEPFHPQLVNGYAVGGVCFLRLGQTRPTGMPRVLGLTTENVAHRFAVEWDTDEGMRVGVFVPRRETDSRIASLAGGRVFPGRYDLARFRVEESEGRVHIEVRSSDSQVHLAVDAAPADDMQGELFRSVDEATEFFRHGAVGFSPSAVGNCLDGVRLESPSWAASPMAIEHMESSLFDNVALFPCGVCILDSALVMRDLRVRWLTTPSLQVLPQAS